MGFVDSHCHVSLSWYEPVEVLLFQMDQNDVEHAILIQIMGQSNNDYQTECVRRYPDRFTSVVIVDTDRPDAPETLARLAEQGAGGVRLRASTRSPGDDPLAIWRAAARLGLSISSGGTASDFADPGFAEAIQAVAPTPVAIEHLGSVNNPAGDTAPPSTRQAVFALARYPNAYMKIHGLGEFARRALPVTEPFPFVQPIPTLLEQAHTAFGASRLMWGSDYPPVSGREGYRNALRLTLERFADASEADRALIFGGVARSVFRAR
jgi:L-fuconolactonase